jgi:ATP-dependent RNA helicase DeaD
MQKFRIRHLQLLVATDVAARGLDVDDLTHIINYSLPDDISAYTHRSGRTGRAGKAGTSIAIINMKEKHLIRQIEKLINKPFVAAKVPGGREICEKQLFNLINKMETVEIDHSEIDPYLPVIYRKLEWIDKEDIIKRFVALEFNRFLEYYKNARDINVFDEPKREQGRERIGRERGRNEAASFTRLRVSAGKADGLFPMQLIELINASSPGKRIRIGGITLGQKETLFEVDSDYAGFLAQALNDIEFNGRELSVSIEKGGTRVENKERGFFKGKGKSGDHKGFRKNAPGESDSRKWSSRKKRKS